MNGLTPEQQKIVLSANDFLRLTPFSKSGLIDKLIDLAIYNAEDIATAINSMDIDYQQQAIRSAKLRLFESPYTKKSLAGALIEYGRYTQEDTAVAVAQMDLKE